MKRKLALPVFFLVSVICAVWSAAEGKPSEEALLREQLIQAAASADAVYYYPDCIDSNQFEGPVTDARYVEEICALLREIEPADDVEWPAGEEQYLLSKASFVLLSGHDTEDLTTADGAAGAPRCYILTDRDKARSLLFVHNGTDSYKNEDYRLIGMLPFTGLDYTIAQDKRLQYTDYDRGKYENLTLTVEGNGWSARLQTGEAQPSGDGHSDVPYALFGTAPDLLLEAGSINCDATTAELRSFSLRKVDDVLGYPGFCFERRTWGGRITSYYAVTENGMLLAGVSHGGPFDADDHSADLDGDGRSELFCNSSGSADGWTMPSVFRLRGGVVEEGKLNEDFYFTLSDEPLWGGATQEYYDAERGAFVVCYVLPGTEEIRTVELTDYDHFTFAPPSSYAPFYARTGDIDFRFEWDENTTVRVRTAEDSVLGFPGYEVAAIDRASRLDRRFFALTGDGTLTDVARTFGLSFDFDGEDHYNYVLPLDLNGDGRSELLARVSYTGSGVDRFYAFRWNEESGTAEMGRIFWDMEALFQRVGPLGEHQRLEEYDAERGVFVLKYDHYYPSWDAHEWESMELPLEMESFIWSAYTPSEM